MAIDVILPALGMSQDTGKILRWLKAEGDPVAKGEPLAEIETDKATVEIEAEADGVLTGITAAEGDDVPVGQVIATITIAGEVVRRDGPRVNGSASPAVETLVPTIIASPLASRIAAEHNLDLKQVKAAGRRIQKSDVLNYLQSQEQTTLDGSVAERITARLVLASPKARRLASEHGQELAAIKGSGPEGAVLAADVLSALAQVRPAEVENVGAATELVDVSGRNDVIEGIALSNTWRVMAQRTTQSWTSVPHFYLVREVNASRLIDWRAQVLKRSTEKITYSDLLVKIVAAALRMHPRLNASWSEGKITISQEVHVGLAVAIEEGLVVPVMHRADTLSLDEIARLRKELVAKAQAGKLRPADISGGTFTISNLGMYGVDAFNAIINQPQAGMLAVGRIADRVVPINGQPAVQPMMILTLSGDHRAIDGARGAQFLTTLAELIEEPLALLTR
jgi:pyruvate dehydrogenase E2 component (dihydrolipoamide acetyltransferase)